MRTIRWTTLALTAALPLAACGGGGGGATSASTATTAPAVTDAPALTDAPATAPTTAAPATTATTAAPAAGKVSANDATRAELEAAFTTAGISSPAQWAREVTEYRPYATDDPTFAKLRQNLAKYNPGPGVVDQIVATLAP